MFPVGQKTHPEKKQFENESVDKSYSMLTEEKKKKKKKKTVLISGKIDSNTKTLIETKKDIM